MCSLRKMRLLRSLATTKNDGLPHGKTIVPLLLITLGKAGFAKLRLDRRNRDVERMMDYVYRQCLADGVVTVVGCDSVAGDGPFGGAGDLGLIIGKKLGLECVEGGFRYAGDLHGYALAVVVTGWEIRPFLLTTVITSS